eukprot:gene10232-11326_t
MFSHCSTWCRGYWQGRHHHSGTSSAVTSIRTFIPLVASLTTMRSSIWLKNAGVSSSSSSIPLSYTSLNNVHDIHFDVAVIGGGVVGCTTAYLLKEAGKSVALIEARHIGTGITGFSTAKLSAQQGLLYTMIAQKHDISAARNYYDMNIEGVNLVEHLVHKLNLDCDFSRRSHTTWTSDTSKEGLIYQEYELCAELGIPCSVLDNNRLCQEIPETIQPKIGLSFPDQAQFNSYKYCVELCKHIQGGDCQVFEETMVHDVSESTPHKIDVPGNNASLTANHVVLATHIPILDRSMHFAILEPSRTHCVAAKIRDLRMHNMFINSEQPTRSLRITGEYDDILVVAGDAVKQGEGGDTNQYYADLEQWIRRHFDVEEVVASWSAMDYYSGDHIPFIGYLHRGSDSLYTATGFSKWGLANGVTGAKLIVDLIQGKHDSPFNQLVDARRWDLSSQWKTMAEESIHTAKHFFGDKVKHAVDWMDRPIEALGPSQGGICAAGMKKVGAYREESGSYHVIRPAVTWSSIRVIKLGTVLATDLDLPLMAMFCMGQPAEI